MFTDGGNDTVRISTNDTGAGSIAEIASYLHLDGGIGTDTLVVDDAATLAGINRIGVLTDHSLAGLGMTRRRQPRPAQPGPGGQGRERVRRPVHAHRRRLRHDHPARLQHHRRQGAGCPRGTARHRRGQRGGHQGRRPLGDRVDRRPGRGERLDEDDHVRHRVQPPADRLARGRRSRRGDRGRGVDRRPGRVLRLRGLRPLPRRRQRRAEHGQHARGHHRRPHRRRQRHRLRGGHRRQDHGPRPGWQRLARPSTPSPTRRRAVNPLDGKELDLDGGNGADNFVVGLFGKGTSQGRGHRRPRRRHQQPRGQRLGAARHAAAAPQPGRPARPCR